MLCIKTFSRTTLEFGEKGIHKLPYLFKHDFFVNLKYIYLLTCSYLSKFLNFSLKELRNCISFLSREVIILFRTGLCKSVLIFFGKLGYRVSVFFAFSVCLMFWIRYHLKRLLIHLKRLLKNHSVKFTWSLL